MNKPLVSICCTAFNHQDYIEDTLKGFLIQQTNFNFEILIHDDASTDDTQAIIKAYQLKNPNIFNSILQSENQYSKGVKPFIAHLFPKAQGKYIAMCEGDDFWTDPLKLQKQVDFLEANPDYVVTYHDFVSIKDNNTYELKKSMLQDSDKMDCNTEDLMANRKWIKTLTMCFRNVVSDFPQEINFVKNGDVFLISYLGNFGKGKWMGEQIEPGVYREHEGGVWSATNTQRRNIDFINTYYWIFQYYARIGKIDISRLWFDKMIRHLNRIESTAFNQSESIFSRYEKQKKHINMLENSMPYKIGRLLTSPVRMLKSVFN